MLMFLLVVASIASAAEIIYVDADASAGGGDGSTWDTAFKYLQDGLAAASYGDEIRVAQGSYKPDLDEAGSVTPGNREETFQLINGVALKGGYAGAGEPEPNERDIEVYETILSGDLAGNDEPDFANYGDNSYHVVMAMDMDTTAELDGFTITSGNANGGSDHYYRDYRGGGMHILYGSPTVTNCTFTANSARCQGGGIYNDSSHGSVPRLTNCTFIGNSAGTHGGGFYNYPDGNLTITNCTFIGNSAKYTGGGIGKNGGSMTLNNCIFIGNSTVITGGGGLYSGYANLTITNCIFIGNSAGNDGGGISLWACYLTLVNCTFSGNSAENDGGGIYMHHGGLTLTNCTLTGNSADGKGGGIYGWLINLVLGNITMTNSIMWDNLASDGPQFAIYDSDSYINYCNIQGGELDIYDPYEVLIWGDGNMGEDMVNDDPLFVDVDNDDYHLLSSAGRWDPDTSSWVIDGVTSPCIDAGDPNSDWSAELWPHGKQINMGAYGGTAQASMSTSSVGNIADMDTDGSVDGIDLTILADKWLYQQVLLSEDLDRDGSVKFKDFAIFAGEWFWEE